MITPKRLLHFFVMLAVFAICLSGLRQTRMKLTDIRRTAKLTYDEPVKNAPPTVAFVTIALGGFRGLLADVLFLRSQSMHESGNYYELVQLASWLVDLQPRFTGATAYLAWNMSYNVSVTFNDPEDRWRWVQRGIELIRDKGLDANPGDPILFKELGWIYQHKVGHILDDANMYYKSQLAMQIINVVGTRGNIDWRALADAPNNETELFASLSPEQTAALNHILAARQETLLQVEDAMRRTGSMPPSLRESLEKVGLYSTLDLYCRSRWMREVYKLEPEIIVGLIEKYGYLDFRLPEAHAIYWATRGLEKSEGRDNLDCQRMIFQSMMNSFKYGKLLYLARDGRPVIGPNLAIVDSTRAEYLRDAKIHSDNTSIMSGYENFMKDAIVLLYSNGQSKKADTFLKALREEFPTNPAYRNTTIDQFAIKELQQDITDKSLKQVTGLVVQFISQSITMLALGEDEAAASYDKRARELVTFYNKDKDTERHADRTGLPPYETELRPAIINLYVDPTTSPLPENLQRVLRERLNLPPIDPNAPAGAPAAGYNPGAATPSAPAAPGTKPTYGPRLPGPNLLNSDDPLKIQKN